MIRVKIEEYLKRAEVLKETIQNEGDKKAKKAVGVNGGTGTKGSKCVLMSLAARRRYLQHISVLDLTEKTMTGTLR